MIPRMQCAAKNLAGDTQLCQRARASHPDHTYLESQGRYDPDGPRAADPNAIQAKLTYISLLSFFFPFFLLFLIHLLSIVSQVSTTFDRNLIRPAMREYHGFSYP